MIVLKVTINDREMAFSSSKTYGPYPQIKILPFQLQVKRSKTFTTQTKTIKAKGFKIQYRDNFEF